MTVTADDARMQASDDQDHVHQWVVDDALPGLRQCVTCPIAEPI